MNRKIEHSSKAHPSRSMGPNVLQVIPSAIEHIDPFVFLDHFGPFQRKVGEQGVPPHPHAGIATITYLFSGSNRHQDSYGHDVMIYAGDLAWMQAGKGIIHSEGMNEKRTQTELVHGLQFWISLPAKDKFIEPDFFYVPSKDLPSFTIGSATVKVLCGELMGHKPPINSLSPAFMYEIKLPANETITIPIKLGDTAGLYLVDGNIMVDEKDLPPKTMTSFLQDADQIEVTSIVDSHFMLFGGTPLNEPIVGYASFVMNSDAQIHQVMMDYKNGKMGILK